MVIDLAHPTSLTRNIDELMEVAPNDNEALQSVLRNIVGRGHELGVPTRAMEKMKRVQEKAGNDYMGNARPRCPPC